MHSFRQKFGFSSQMIQYLRINPLNCILDSEDGKGACYVGNIYSAYSIDILQRYNVTAILTVASGTQLKYKEDRGFKYRLSLYFFNYKTRHLIIQAEDMEYYNLSKDFERMINFISNCRNEGRNVLIHCFAGISRSATSLIAYMVKELGYTYRKALTICKQRRNEIQPNPGFLKQLREYELKQNLIDINNKQRSLSINKQSFQLQQPSSPLKNQNQLQQIFSENNSQVYQKSKGTSNSTTKQSSSNGFQQYQMDLQQQYQQLKEKEYYSPQKYKDSLPLQKEQEREREYFSPQKEVQHNNGIGNNRINLVGTSFNNLPLNVRINQFQDQKNQTNGQKNIFHNNLFPQNNNNNNNNSQQQSNSDNSPIKIQKTNLNNLTNNSTIFSKKANIK